MDRHQYRTLKPRSPVLQFVCFPLIFSLFTTFLTGCFSVPRVKTHIHESPRGKVTLRTFSDPSFRTTHPQIVEPSVLTQLLRGLHIQEQKEPIASLITGQTLTERTFTEGEISFLAPLLASALRQATAEEQVLFSLSNQTRTGTEQTEGSLYIDGPALQFTLTHYRFNSPRPALLSRPSYSFNRPRLWRLVFYPEGAVLHTAGDSLTPKSLAIRYERLSTYPASAFRMPATREGSSVSGSSTSSPASGNDQQTERELETMKEELEKLRKSLREQDSKLEDLEKQIPPPKN